MIETPATAVETTWWPSRAEFRDAYRRLASGRVAAVLGWAFTAFGVFAALFVRAADGRSTAEMGVPVAVFGVLMILYPWWAAALAWRSPLRREQVTVRVDAEGVAQRSPSGTLLIRWVAISRAVETADTFYVRVGTGLIWFPKRALSAPEQETVRALLRTHVRAYRG
ncbi:YcxB family protein [Xylanimonas sp. McL0601]|uniref:YcxB family protein n=1 Tax=Xylanimonas sp. McL0601 TaxID=3414739 RepID=UPI003CF360B2